MGVSSDVDEVLLGWRALQRLKIIPENFPRPKVDCRKIVGEPAQTDSKSGPNVPREGTKTLKSEDPKVNVEEAMKNFLEVFEEPGEGKLKPMKGGFFKDFRKIFH